MRVGITFFHQEGGSIWNSGAVQQCTFLCMCLAAIPGVEVVPINAGHDIDTPPGLLLDDLDFVRLPDVVDTLDVLIQCYGQVSAEDVERVKRNGGKAIAYKFGNEYVIDAERIIHGKKSGGIVNGARFDEIWTNAQHLNTCQSYWETVYRCPVRCMPHIWSPRFVDQLDVDFGYKPGRKARRITIYEPNINIVKVGIIPMLACEQVFRSSPGLIEYVLVQNSEHLKKGVTFKHLCSSLDICNAVASDGHAVCSFQGRARFPWHAALFTDVVVSHQVENGLNYAYYEALYGGYPLVHNSDLLPVGYKYSGFDIYDAARALREALQCDERVDYSDYLDTVLATASANVAEYAGALRELTWESSAA